MRIHLFFGLAVLAFAASPLGCASEQAGDEVSSPSEEGSEADELRSLQLTDADDGKTVTVTKGQNVLVKLQSNPSTGYKWVVASTNRTFGYPASDRFTAASNGPVGSGGVQRLTWKTSSVLDMIGSHTVRLEYKRSWENNVAPAKTFSFTVNIVDGSCPTLSPPAPDFCKSGEIAPRRGDNGCNTGYECLSTK